MKSGLINIFLILLITTPLSAQPNQLTLIDDVYPEEIRLAGFKLDGEQKIDVEAAVLSSRWNYREFSFSYAWILNAETRQMVWELEDAKLEERKRPLIIFKDQINLPAGTYEVYYSTYPYSANYSHEDGFFSGLFGFLFHDDRQRFYDDDFENLYIKVYGNGSELDKDALLKLQEKLRQKAVISLTSLGDDEDFSNFLNITRPVKLRIYALGEARRDEVFDFGWLINSKTREKVWQLNYRNSDHAGGANKNRAVNEEIKLEPGIYEVLYVTDDSHSFRRWNAPPPLDPYFWGITIWPSSNEDRQYVNLLPEVPEQQVVIAFNRVRDSEYLAKGFKLTRPLSLHIFALGEGRDDEMFDYGWIIDSKSRQIVWEMRYEDTENAGGAAKNRLFDNIVRLEPGNYIAYYLTDDSHAYHSWNDSKPVLGNKWGMTISVADESYREGDVLSYNEDEDQAVLAKITRVGDHDRRRAKFSIESTAQIHIYAIGEGTRGEMYDYAWIEDAQTGRVIWEMTYHKTERAGGDRKNRLFNDTIDLPAGEYNVIYESDDSHSFEDWNARPPRDPFNYGITITMLEK